MGPEGGSSEPRNDLSTAFPKCKECGYIHPPDPSGKCSMNHPTTSSTKTTTIIKTNTLPPSIDDFLKRLGKHLETEKNSENIIDGICKLLNI